MAATNVVNSGDSEFYSKPVLSDEIVAIGLPDQSLAKELNQPDLIAFVGLKNTYLLYKGGKELEQLTHLNLDGKHMLVDSSNSLKLFVKDNQVWGSVGLTYISGKPVTEVERTELEKGGFTVSKGPNKNIYQREIAIAGIIYPAITLTSDQLSKLTIHRAFNLYNPRDSKPPMMGKILKSPLIVLGVATDIVLFPVYVVATGVGIVILSIPHK
jgi:hypothetical protein